MFRKDFLSQYYINEIAYKRIPAAGISDLRATKS